MDIPKRIDIIIMGYSKTCAKQPLSKRPKNWISIPIIAKCRSKVLQNAPRRAFCNTFDFIKLPFVIQTFVVSGFEWGFYTGFTVVHVVTCQAGRFVRSNVQVISMHLHAE